MRAGCIALWALRRIHLCAVAYTAREAHELDGGRGAGARSDERAPAGFLLVIAAAVRLAPKHRQQSPTPFSTTPPGEIRAQGKYIANILPA
jgi:hypothetical protein